MDKRKTKQPVFASATKATVIDYSGGNQADVDFDAIYIGIDGNLAVITKEGDEVTFVGLLGGTILPVAITQITQSGSTAASCLGLTW